MTLVTGGFVGVGETVAKSFFDERQRLNRREDVWHILPVRDEQVRYVWLEDNFSHLVIDNDWFGD